METLDQITRRAAFERRQRAAKLSPGEYVGLALLPVVVALVAALFMGEPSPAEQRADRAASRTLTEIEQREANERYACARFIALAHREWPGLLDRIEALEALAKANNDLARMEAAHNAIGPFYFDVPDFDDCGGRTMRRVEVPKAVLRDIVAAVEALKLEMHDGR